MRLAVPFLAVSVVFLAGCGRASARCTSSGCPASLVCDAALGVCRVPTPAALQDGAGADGGTGGGLIGGGQPPADPCRGIPLEGRCASSSVVEACVTPTGNSSPRVQRTTCAADEACGVVQGRAVCRLVAECKEGASRCNADGSVEVCASGGWLRQACATRCVSNPLGAFCSAVSAGTTYSGSFEYEFKSANAELSDWGGSQFGKGVGFLVVSFSNGKPVDATTTDEGGKFTLQVPSPPGPNDSVAILAAGGGGEDNVGYAVASPGLSGSGEREIGAEVPNARAWGWSWPVSKLPAGGLHRVGTAQGSAAARIFDYARYIRSVMADALGKPGGTTLIWFQQGIEFGCGTCFVNAPVEALDNRFDSQVFIAGGADEGYWSEAVLAHELGHWTMSAYGTSPQEGGPHMVGRTSLPGLSWSEGWATWLSSFVRGDSRYYDKQHDVFFWFDLAQREYGSGYAWQRPSASKGLLQQTDENEVAAMLLGLSSSSESAGAELLKALASPRMNGTRFARGYTRHYWELGPRGEPTNIRDTGESRPCLADFLDALNCAGFSRASLDAATEPYAHYPYPSSQPLCR